MNPESIRAILVADHPRLEFLWPAVLRGAALICASHRAGGKLLSCGNGGSAADAEHLVGELAKGFLAARPPDPAHVARLRDSDPAWSDLAPKLQRGLAAFSLAGNGALATAIINDQHADLLFAQQVHAVGRAGDVLVAFSTSGNSRNVVRALEVARALGIATIGFSGERPARIDGLCEVMLKVPATETFRVQECHLPLYHALCALVEVELFG